MHRSLSVLVISFILSACSQNSSITQPASSPGSSVSPTATPTSAPSSEPSPAPSPQTAEFELLLAPPVGFYAPESELRFEITRAAELEQTARNQAFQRDCGSVLSMAADALPDINFPARRKACLERQSIEYKEVRPESLNQRLDADNRLVVPLAQIAEGEAFEISLKAQPKDTCFEVRKSLSLRRQGKQLRLSGFENREGWQYRDPQGNYSSDPKASSCLQGQVSDQNGQPVAGALVIPHLTQAEFEMTQPLAKTDAQGRYRLLLNTQELNSFEGFELQIGKSGYLPAKVQGVAEPNAAWLPNLNRHDVRLSSAQSIPGARLDIFSTRADRQFDLDYAIKLELRTRSAESLDPQNPDTSPDTLVRSSEISWREYNSGATLSADGLRPGDFYEIKLQGHEPGSGCPQTTYRYFGLLGTDNQLNLSRITGISQDLGCFHSFPLRLKITDSAGNPLTNAEVEASWTNPILNPAGEETTRKAISQNGRAVIENVVLQQGLHLDQQSVSLLIRKSGYQERRLTFTVKKPNGNPGINQLTVALETL